MDRVDRLKNVSIIKQANIYFEGKVTSRSVFLADGDKKTLGIMLPGQYEFATGDKEIMEILAGSMSVLLPGSDDWIEVKGGQSFEVAAQSKFKLVVHTVADYCCAYIKE